MQTDPQSDPPAAGRRLHPLAGCGLFILAAAVLTVLLPFGRTPDKIYEDSVSKPPAALPELPYGVWVGVGKRSLTEPGMWVDGQEGDDEALRLTLQSPGFGTRATVRAEIDGGEGGPTAWTARVEIESLEGRLGLRFDDGERWRLDPDGEDLRLIVTGSRREGLAGESFVLGLRSTHRLDEPSGPKADEEG